jgi:hypothetical protein
MEKSDLEAFRLRAQVNLIEQLVLKLAFREPVLNHQLSGQASRDLLQEWLDSNTTAALSAYGGHFQGDPAQSALYAEEVRGIVEKMKKTVDECYETWRKIDGS